METVNWQTYLESEATEFETGETSILHAALDQAWDFLPPKRRTRANRDAMASVIVRSAARGHRDPGLLSIQALSRILPELPRDGLDFRAFPRAP